MRILYPFKKYSKPKKVKYYTEGNEYNSDSSKGEIGWNKIIKETIIIGEDEHWYITDLKEHVICDINDPDYGEAVLLPSGFHKSRLIKNQIIQMMLF